MSINIFVNGLMRRKELKKIEAENSVEVINYNFFYFSELCRDVELRRKISVVTN
jgi:hypothetical protein